MGNYQSQHLSSHCPRSDCWLLSLMQTLNFQYFRRMIDPHGFHFGFVVDLLLFWWHWNLWTVVTYFQYCWVYLDCWDEHYGGCCCFRDWGCLENCWGWNRRSLFSWSGMLSTKLKVKIREKIWNFLFLIIYLLILL